MITRLSRRDHRIEIATDSLVKCENTVGDSETEAVLGLLDAQIWTREDAIEAAPRRQRAIEDKESMRWLRGVERAGALLTDAASVVVVGDRESDIYSCFARRAAGVDLIVRAAQDRLTAGAQQGPAGDASLFTSPAAWPELTQMLVKVAPRRVGDPGRIATVALRAGPVILKRPRHGSAKTDPETVAMTLVEAREINPPANQEPLHWRLLTSLEVGDAEAACEIVRLYRLRWRIEEVFRALKSDGMRLEETQMHEAHGYSSWPWSAWRRRVERCSWSMRATAVRDRQPT